MFGTYKKIQGYIYACFGHLFTWVMDIFADEEAKRDGHSCLIQRKSDELEELFDFWFSPKE